jgi:hypothetical protein
MLSGRERERESVVDNRWHRAKVAKDIFVQAHLLGLFCVQSCCFAQLSQSVSQSFLPRSRCATNGQGEYGGVAAFCRGRWTRKGRMRHMCSAVRTRQENDYRCACSHECWHASVRSYCIHTGVGRQASTPFG